MDNFLKKITYILFNIKVNKRCKNNLFKKIEHLNFLKYQPQDFIINKPKLSKNKKNVIITNLGYNFLKIILSLRKKISL